jgi:hypothetical protein
VILRKLTYTFRQKDNLETKKEIKIPEYIMSNSDIIIIFKPELKENLILRQIYYHNTSSNINNEIHSSDIHDLPHKLTGVNFRQPKNRTPSARPRKTLLYLFK